MWQAIAIEIAIATVSGNSNTQATRATNATQERPT